jgi:putative hemin transport protein
MITETQTLKQRYEAFKLANPKTRIRDAAKEMGVSEAELLYTGLGSKVTLLQTPFEALLQEVRTLGYVMALTRNEFCVNERKGVYENVSFSPHSGIVLGPDIDLRLFIIQWAFGFAVTENDRKSLQFFDVRGTALHKIYLTERSNTEAYDVVVKSFSNTDQLNFSVTKESVANKAPDLADSEIDVSAFQSDWNNMVDSHEFFGILRKHKLSRTQALRLAPDGRARKVDLEGFKRVMATCAEQQVPIMVFTGNTGCIQIHTGNINRIVNMDNWFNVLDPEFNLHLRVDGVVSVWHVVKPSTDGDVNSLELFDAQGDMIVQIFGKRKPGLPELQTWRNVLSQAIER